MCWTRGNIWGNTIGKPEEDGREWKRMEENGRGWHADAADFHR